MCESYNMVLWFRKITCFTCTYKIHLNEDLNLEEAKIWCRDLGNQDVNFYTCVFLLENRDTYDKNQKEIINIGTGKDISIKGSLNFNIDPLFRMET